ncbi:hypothetical protein D9M72_606970 [compost metagenome]
MRHYGTVLLSKACDIQHRSCDPVEARGLAQYCSDRDDPRPTNTRQQYVIPVRDLG